MKKSLLVILLPVVLFAHNAMACSLAPNFAVIKKNEMIVAAINHMGLDLQEIKNLQTSDYVFNFSWTFSDPGFECHDTENGSLNVQFSSDKVLGMYAAFYDIDIKKQYDDLAQANDWVAIYELDNTEFQCDILINVVHKLIPTSADQSAYPQTYAEAGVAVCKK